MYYIIELRTRFVVGKAKTLKGAKRSADKRNMKYGAHGYTVISAADYHR